MFTKADLKNILFEATVVGNNDPDNRQRVRIRVPVVHDQTKDADLPWAIKAAQSFCGAGAGYGSYNVPALGSIVYVEFQQGDAHNPMYSAERVMPISGFSKDEYGFQDIKGTKFKVSKLTGQITFTNTAGKVIKWNPDGTLEVDIEDLIIKAKDATIECENATIEATAIDVTTDTANITAQSITVSCPSTDFNP